MAVKPSRSLPISFCALPTVSQVFRSSYGSIQPTVHMLLKQTGLLLELISLPQSQPVKILHSHAKHLGKFLWGQVTLRTQG